MSSHIGVELPFGLYQTTATISQGYDDNDHGNPSSNPFDAILYYSIDFVVPRTTPIIAEDNGTVVSVVQNYADSTTASIRAKENHGYGNLITIQYANGYYATYLHLAQNSVSNNGLTVGSTVKIGQAIGDVGLTGNISGPHIHVTYGLSETSIGQLANNNSDPNASAEIANGSYSASGPPVYLMSTWNGLPSADGSTISSDNLANYASSVPPTVKVVPLDGTYATVPYAPIPVESVGVNQSNNMQGWFFANDASGDQVTWWAIYDTNADPQSGYLSVSSGEYYNSAGRLVTFSGRAPANTVVLVSSSALSNSNFVGGSQNGKYDFIDIAAANSTSWSAWQSMLVATQTTPAPVQSAASHAANNLNVLAQPAFADHRFGNDSFHFPPLPAVHTLNPLSSNLMEFWKSHDLFHGDDQFDNSSDVHVARDATDASNMPGTAHHFLNLIDHLFL